MGILAKVRSMTVVALEPGQDEAPTTLSRLVGGRQVQSRVVCTAESEMFHEGPVRLDERHVMCTSNRLNKGSRDERIDIVVMDIYSGTWGRVRNNAIQMANGATGDGKGNVIICDQGKGEEGGGIHWLNPWTGESRRILDGFRGSDGSTKRFNSPNDVIQSGDGGTLWFTDPCYGHEQGFRHGHMDCESAVWAYASHAGSAMPVASHFVKPNGIALSPKETHLLVTDTGYYSGFGVRPENPRRIERFRILWPSLELEYEGIVGQCEHGVPDGIKCDEEENIFVACGDGVHIWGADGIFVGKLRVAGGVSNLAFAGPRHSTLVLLNETRAIACEVAAIGAVKNPA